MCLSRISLEPRFKNLLYKYNKIKSFHEKTLITEDIKPFQDFKSNNVSIKNNQYKYVITSKDSIVSTSLYTALSILSLKIDDHKPIFLMDHFNISDITYMKLLIDDFPSLKLFFKPHTPPQQPSATTPPPPATPHQHPVSPPRPATTPPPTTNTNTRTQPRPAPKPTSPPSPQGP